jgi:DNA-binding CsgD family transcriptional regulator/sugar-specific transcriptional regulator TrmB
VDNPLKTRSSTSQTKLQDVDVKVYTWVLRQHSLRAELAAAELALAEEETRASFQRLLDAQLVQPSPADPLIGFAVAPETALTHLSAPYEARIREDQHTLSAFREELERFTAPYQLNSGANSSAFELVQNLQQVRDTLNSVSAHCETEMISAQPGGGARVPAAMEEAIQRDRRLLERGVAVRTLYHHTARFNAPSQAYVAIASSLGGQYRTAHALFGRLIAFDRSTAFVPLHDGSLGAIVIREPNTVNYLCEIFEQTWETATPFADAASQGLEQVSREAHATILKLLAAGLKDETIARRLGMSLRTARRHIADIMQDLNAASRFQAGVAAAAAGLLDTPEHGDRAAVRTPVSTPDFDTEL